MYWDGSESICDCLNSLWHELQLPVFVKILIMGLMKHVLIGLSPIYTTEDKELTHC